MVSEIAPRVRVCCGARCGAEPHHRAIYDAVETAAKRAGYETTPTMCRASCTGGVTVILPPLVDKGAARKVSALSAANSVLDGLPPP